MSDPELDELLQPTISTGARQPRGKPWRVQSQFWVAFFGGVLSVTVIALINAHRLGLDRRKRWLMAAAAVVALAVVFAFWMRQAPAADFAAFARQAREMRVIGRIVAVVLFLILAALQKRAEAHYLTFSGGEYASLWGAGTAALLLGAVQTPILAFLAWAIRQ